MEDFPKFNLSEAPKSIEKDVFPNIILKNSSFTFIPNNKPYWIDMGTLESYDQVQKDAPKLRGAWSK